MADSKLTALSEISAPSLEDLLYWVDDPSGTPVSNKVSATRALGLLNHVCQGRLTLESGVPVSTSDQTSKTNVYFTPYNGNRIAIYDGTRWRLYTFTELTLALGTLTSGNNYDVFIYDNAGTLTLELSAAWTSDTARNDALTTQDGVYVKSGATTRRYLGTIRTTSTTTTEDSEGGSTTQVGGKRFVWNLYNQVRRAIKVVDKTDSWSYTTDTWRQSNGASGNKVEYVSGAVDAFVQAVFLNVLALASNTRDAKTGIGVDSTTAPSGNQQGAFSNAVSTIVGPCSASYSGTPGLGYHYLSMMEKGADNTSSFYGDNGVANGFQTGLIASINA